MNDGLIFQLIQILQQCRNSNDLHFVIDLFEVTSETMLHSKTINAPKMKKILEECEIAIQRILEKNPNILKDINKNLELKNLDSQSNRYSVAVEPNTIAPLKPTVPGTVLITSLSLGFSVLWLMHFLWKKWKQFIN